MEFEYIDRDRDSKIVQAGEFDLITAKNQLKIGERFICPRTKEYPSGIVDGKTLLPILLYKSHEMQSDWHIAFQFHKRNIGKSAAAIAWDLCYKLRPDDFGL